MLRPPRHRSSIRPPAVATPSSQHLSECRCVRSRSAQWQEDPWTTVTACCAAPATVPKKPRREAASAARRPQTAFSIAQPLRELPSTPPPPHPHAKKRGAKRQQYLQRDKGVTHLGAGERDFRHAVGARREIRRRLVLRKPAHDGNRQLAIG